MISGTMVAESELLQYLGDKDLQIQSITKQFFFKYDTSISPSAPVERLFSFGGLIRRSRRSDLNDENFERCTCVTRE